MPEATVLHVGPFPPPIEGGISAYLEGLLRAPLAERYPVEPFDVSVPESCRRHRTLRAGLGLRFLARYRAQLGRTRAAMAHIHTSAHLGFWEKSLLAGMSARRGLPYVLHIHGGDFDAFVRRMPGWQRGHAARTFGGASAVLVLSQAWKPLFADWVTPERLHVVPNAIHVADFTPAQPADDAAPLRMVFVGMLSARKGLDELCTALVTLRREGVAFHVDIVGGEEVIGDGARYRQLYRQAGLDDVQFHGLLGSGAIRSFLKRAHLFVLPSRSESFGIANLEAMASGLPVVSTRTGAIPEYIEDGVHGLLVDPGDVHALTDALRRLARDAPLRQRLGTAARRRALDFDWSTVSARIEEIYTGVLTRR